jgi:hypothetical protein
MHLWAQEPQTDHHTGEEKTGRAYGGSLVTVFPSAKREDSYGEIAP